MRVRLASKGLGLMVASLLGSAGCSGDFGATDDGTTDTDGTAGPLDADTGEGADSTGGDQGPADADDGTGGSEDVCDVDCGPGGWCELDDDLVPYCSCDAGYAAYGLRCLECVPADGPLEIDIPRVMVSATFLLDGEPFPTSSYEHGTLRLHDPVTGDEVQLGDTSYGDTGEAIAVLPGSYEVHYGLSAGGELAPANRGARIATVQIPDTDAHELVIDVPSVRLSGEILLAGSPAPNSIYENGTVVLRNRTTGDEAVLGDSRDGQFAKVVVPGAYEVRYRRRLAQSIAPINADARIDEVVVSPGEDSQPLDIDIPVTMLSGTFTLDGDAPPSSIYENGRIVLRDPRTGDEVELGQTRDASFEVPVVPGSYEVVYRRLVGGSIVPANRAAVLAQVDLRPGAQQLDVDIPTAVITGAITVGGGLPPTDPSNDGLLLLRNPQTGDEAVLGNTHDGSYARRVIRGSYDVHYRQQTSSGGVPANTNAWLQPIVIEGGASFDIDVPMVTVSAEVTLNGELPPDSAYDDGLLYLRDAVSGDSVLLGNTRLASLQRPVVPGTYDLVYVVEAAGPTVPINARAQLATVDVLATPNLLIDIPVSVFSGAISLGGEPPPVSAYERGELLLHDLATADTIPLGSLDLGVLTQSLTAGTYVLVYRWLAGGSLVPANRDAGLRCYELSG